MPYLRNLAVAAILTAAPACTATDDEQATDTSDSTGVVVFAPGVFSLSASDKPADPAVYANPDVAGVAVRTSWESIQATERDPLNWAFLDGEIAAAKAANKKVSIYLAAGLPQWVADKGVQTFTFVDPNPLHNGAIVTMAVPWDPIFLAQWTRFVRAFGARYASEPTIAYVRGASESLTHGWGMPNTDVDGNSWAAYGYTPDKMLAALTRITDAFMAAFPTTAEWIEVGPIKFEPEISGLPETYVAAALTDYGFATYPTRFGVWREDLGGCTPVPPTSPTWLLLYDHPGRDGAQMLWNVQDGPDRMNKCGITPNDKPTVLRTAIGNGIELGMPYVEVYQVDVLDDELAGVIHSASQRLGF